MNGLTKDDSGLIGFVVSAVFNEAITIDEMKKWAELTIMQDENIPLYIYDLVDFSEGLADIYEVIGFAPEFPYDDSEDQAVLGVAFLRGIEPYESNISKKEALEAMEKYPHILNDFRKIFPFISLPS